MQPNKNLEIKEVLDNILLPLDASWCISSVRPDDESGEQGALETLTILSI